MDSGPEDGGEKNDGFIAGQQHDTDVRTTVGMSVTESQDQ